MQSPLVKKKKVIPQSEFHKPWFQVLKREVDKVEKSLHLKVHYPKEYRVSIKLENCRKTKFHSKSFRLTTLND